MTTSHRTAVFQAPSPASARYSSLDGVRGVACLIVFFSNFHHLMGMNVTGRAGPFDLATFGESGLGVLIFIVLSGALLSLPFWRALDGATAPVDVRRFFARRFVRLATPYYLCLAAFIGGRSLWRDPADLAAHVLFVNNLWERSFYSVSPQFWTVGMFAQFAVVVPIGFALLGRVIRRPTAALAVVAAAVPVAYFVHVALMETRERWLFWPVSIFASVDGLVLSHSTLAHLPHFLMGVTVGAVFVALARGSTPPRAWAMDVVFLVALAGLAVLSSVPSAQEWSAVPHGRYFFPWMPILAAAVILSTPFARIGRQAFDLAPLRAIGVISYGIYVFHLPCMQVVQYFLRVEPIDSAVLKLQFGLLSFGATLAAAIGSYFLVERPLLHWIRRRQF